MHPELLHVGNYAMHSYTLMLGLSFALGIWLSRRRAGTGHLDRGAVFDAGLLIALVAIPGARIYYVLLHPDRFGDNLVRVVMGWPDSIGGSGGLVMYGGAVSGLLVAHIYFRMRRLPFLRYADVMAPGVALGVCLTRIGCFLNGCCYGEPYEGPLSVSFPPSSPAGSFQLTGLSAGLFPSQLFESGAGLLILAVVLFAERRKTFDGFQFYLVCLLYAAARFAVDFTRHYGPGERLGSLSHNQVVCTVVFVVVGALIVKNLRLLKRRQLPVEVRARDMRPAEPAGTID